MDQLKAHAAMQVWKMALHGGQKAPASARREWAWKNAPPVGMISMDHFFSAHKKSQLHLLKNASKN